MRYPIAVGIALLLSASLLLGGCSTRGEAEVTEISTHVSKMSEILERHRDEPRIALEELEKYETTHRKALADLNHRVKDLRPQLTSSEKRALSAKWKAQIAELEEKLRDLNKHKPSD